MSYRTVDTSRREIDLATGILVGLGGCSEREAFAELVAVVQHTCIGLGMGRPTCRTGDHGGRAIAKIASIMTTIGDTTPATFEAWNEWHRDREQYYGDPLATSSPRS